MLRVRLIVLLYQKLLGEIGNVFSAIDSSLPDSNFKEDMAYCSARRDPLPLFRLFFSAPQCFSYVQPQNPKQAPPDCGDSWNGWLTVRFQSYSCRPNFQVIYGASTIPIRRLG